VFNDKLVVTVPQVKPGSSSERLDGSCTRLLLDMNARLLQLTTEGIDDQDFHCTLPPGLIDWNDLPESDTTRPQTENSDCKSKHSSYLEKAVSQDFQGNKVA
jgi:hypothetical protein